RVEIVDLGGDLAAERRRVEAIDPLDRRPARAEPGAEGVDPGADRGDDTDPRDPDGASVVAHVDGFVESAAADVSTGAARASAIAPNVARVRPAIGRVKRRSINQAQPGTRGAKAWS